MKAIDAVLKNELSKRVYTRLGVRKPFSVQQRTPHYRIPEMEASGGYITLQRYDGPEIPREEWESLEYVTYPSDPSTFFAPLTSATGENVLRGFWDFGKPDLDGIWTSNAEKAPTLKRYVESLGNRYGRVQLIRQAPNTMRECHWGLHLDDNNRLNPDSNGWVVRLWLELSDDPASSLVLRPSEFDRQHEVRVPLPKYAQAVVDSERLFHGGYHRGPHTRYALITSLESTPGLADWIRSHRS